MATVHTAYGPGKIVDQETVRGRTQYKVAGDGFEVWLDEAKIASQIEGSDDFYRHAWAPMDSDNSTELPYNPHPQHDAVGQSGYDDGSSTLQPIHHIDADERLHSSDSISFDEEGEDEAPGPNPDLFAKQADLGSSYLLKKVVDKIIPKSHPGKELSDLGVNYVRGAGAGHAINAVDNQLSQVLDSVSPGPGWGDLIKGGSRHEANPLLLALPALGEALAGGEIGSALAGAAGRAAGGAALNGLVNGAENFAPGNSDEGWGDLVKDSSYRPAGLSDKYIDITAGADYHNDPVAQFRHDPDAYINRIGLLMDEGLNPRFAEYMDLVEADNGIRTAAWKDVRKKAMRLKREGHVTVKDIAPNRIMASVVGDHGTYDVTILKNGGFGGLNEGMPGHAIANWHCGCEWGRWAFRRKFTYVGRLCSHAYASYLTMQSAHMKGKPRQQKGPQRKKPTRNMVFPSTNMRHADNLQNGPKRLTPDMVVNDTDDAQMFWDVTKDTRKDVGPDDVVSEKDIVHFARLMRHCEVTEQPYPRQLVAFLARYASERDDTPSDYEAPHVEDSKPALERIRRIDDRKQEDDFGDMTDRVHEIQDAVEEARNNGVDASQFVAAVRKMAIPGVGNDNIINSDGTSRTPGLGGASPDSLGQFWQRAQETYINPQDMKPGTAVRQQLDKEDPRGTQRRNEQYGDGKPATPATSDRTPEQRAINRTTLDTGTPSSPTGSSDPDAGKNLNNIPSAGGKGGQASGAPAPAPSNGKGGGGNAGGGSGGGSGSGGGGKGGGAYTAPGGGMTQGPISDGGVAGAENGNNSSIGKDQLDADGYYTVQKGDTLSDIAQRSYGDMNKYQDLAKANGIANPDVINEGQRIKIQDPTGNGGLSGDKTNPAGSTKAVTGPAVSTDAVAPPQAPAAGTPGDSSGTSGSGSGTGTGSGGKAGGGTDLAALTPPPTPAQAAAAPPLAAEAGGSQQQPLTKVQSRQRWAAPNNQANPADPNQGQDGKTNTTAPTTNTKPGAGTATTPSQPGATTPGAAATPGAPAVAQPGGASSPGTGNRAQQPEVGPSKEDDTYDPNDPTQNQQQQATGPGTGSGMGGGMGGADALSTGIGAAGDIASGLGNALPGIAEGIGNAMPNIADAAGSIASGLGSIFASKQDFDDWVRYAYPTADGEGKLEPHDHPFAGSGWAGPLEIGTSEEYADKMRPKMDDVTDLGSGPLAKPLTKWQRQSAVEDDFDPYREASFEESTDDASDIVRAFQANLGDTALGAGAGGGGRFDDIAGAAAGFLRTAGRNYSLAEQSELIREGDKGGARNLGSLDLTGTHYEDMHTLGW